MNDFQFQPTTSIKVKNNISRSHKPEVDTRKIKIIHKFKNVLCMPTYKIKKNYIKNSNSKQHK